MLRRLSVLCVFLMVTSCTYGQQEERVSLAQIVRLGDSYEALVVTRYERFRPPTGFAAFPDGGKARVLQRLARLYLVDASKRTASLLAEQAAPDSLWESFSLSVRGLEGDTAGYVQLTGCPRNGECHPQLLKSIYLRISRAGEVRAVERVPTDARLSGAMLARRKGEEHYVRFGSHDRTVTARFEEEGPYLPLARVNADGSLTPIGR